MNCSDMIVLISGYLDGINSGDENTLVQEHLSHCASCREVLVHFQNTDALLKTQEAELPATFCAGVMERIKEETGRKKRNLRLWSSIGASAAAVALILGAGALTMPRMGSDGSAMETQMEEAIEYSVTKALYDAADEEAVVETEYCKPKEQAAAEMPLAAYPQAVADRVGGVVVYFDHPVEELEEYSVEVTDGNLMYLLSDAEEAAELGETYGGVLFFPADLQSYDAYALVICD